MNQIKELNNKRNLLNDSIQVYIGVTGHRKVVITQELLETIEKSLLNDIGKILFQESLSKKETIRYNIMSSLADGADRIIVDIAKRKLGANLNVILPMQKAEYQKTFFSKKSIFEFENMLKYAHSIKILIDESSNKYYNNKNKIKCRNLAFQKAGRYIVDNCDVLVALWDGKNTKKIGGTSDTVYYAKSMNKKIIIISPEDPYKISI